MRSVSDARIWQTIGNRASPTISVQNKSRIHERNNSFKAGRKSRSTAL